MVFVRTAIQWKIVEHPDKKPSLHHHLADP